MVVEANMLSKQPEIPQFGSKARKKAVESNIV